MARVICFDCSKRGRVVPTAPPAKRRIPSRFERLGVGFFIGCCLFSVFVPFATGPVSAALALVLGASSVAWCLYVAHESGGAGPKRGKNLE